MKKQELWEDNIYHVSWEPGQILDCPRPAVIGKYGRGGRCLVCIYTCRKCKYHEEENRLVYGGVRCGYGKEEKNGSIGNKGSDPVNLQ